uniref:beta strand repeat-containing protein n=1 Tax=Zoogloea sp. TaxID=49181 RepID=UPI0035AFB821
GLAAGETLTQVYSVSITDNHGASVTQDITVTLTGTNDAPTLDVLASDLAGGVTERPDGAPDENSATLASSGTLIFADVDGSDSHAASIAASVHDGAGNLIAAPLGSLSLGVLDPLTKTVGWNYSVPAGLLDGLAAGETLTQVYSVSITDNHGASVTQDITVTLTGTNDAPVLTADTDTARERGGLANGVAGFDATGDVLANDSDVDLADTLHVVEIAAVTGSGSATAVAAGSTSSAGYVEVAGAYGVLRIGADGSYIYLVDEQNAAVQALRTAADTLQDVFSYAVGDGTTQVASTLTVSVEGANDAPTLIHISNTALTEITGPNATTASIVDVGTLSTDDPDDGDSFTYDIIGGAQQFYFQIASVAGVPTLQLKAGVPLNAEFLSAYSVVVRSTDALGLSTFQTFVVSIGDVNEFQVSTPVFDVEPMGVGIAPNTVAENTPVGTFIGVTASASDADASNNTITYSLVGSLAGAPYTANEFTIDPATGQISVAGPIDRETGGDSRTVFVKALSADGSSKIGSLQVFVSDVNEFAVGAASDADASANTVVENAAVGMQVGVTAFATDADATTNAVSYSLVNPDGSAYTGGEFAIGAGSGVVTVAGSIDREAGATRTLYVRATSADGSHADQSFIINVGDVNEFAVTQPVDADLGANAVVENAAVGTTVGVTAFATDADATTNAVSYSLVNADGSAYTGGEFAVGAGSGVVTVAGSIDREAGATRTLYVRATSADGSHADQSFVVSVADLNDNAPVFVSGTSGSVAENAPTATVIYTAQTSDADATAVNRSVTYALAAGGDAALLDIDAATGAVTLKASADFETQSSYSFIVQALDGANVTSQAVTVTVQNVEEAAVGSLAVSGAAEQGGTLTASLTASDVDGAITAVAYQWQQRIGDVWRDIPGATGASYTLSADQSVVGSVGRVVATTTDVFGGTTAFVSSAVTIANVNDAPTGKPAVAGTATQGETLSASAGTLADADGLGVISYQWLADGTAIGGATGSTLVLGEAQVGREISVLASYTDGFGHAESVASNRTVAVRNVNDAPTGGVAIVGTAIQNATLAVVSTLADADGLGVVTYKWMSGATQLGTGSSYTLGAADVGRSIHVVASWTDGHGTSESVSSAATSAVANVNDAPTGSLDVTGNAEQGQTLSAVSTLADADGMGTIAYQWLADGVAIAGATGSNLTLTPDQVGKAISVQASWTDGQGSAEHVTSAATAKINAVNTQQEGNAPSLGGGTAGDGNGDGIPDATQSAVVSAPVTVTSSGASSYVTLVADSTAGKVAEGSTSTVTSFNQTATAAYMPAASLTPLGSVNFSASTDTVSGLEHFSLYVDNNLGINGYWVTNADGTLINLASDAYGGRMVVEGDKLRLDFQIQDGGTLDHDGSANGNVQVDGAVGYVPLSLIAYTPDAPAQHDTTQVWD